MSNDTSAEQAAREKAWRKYADTIDVDYTAPTVRDDFDAGWRNCAAWQREHPVSEAEVLVPTAALEVVFSVVEGCCRCHDYANGEDANKIAVVRAALEAARRVGADG